MRKSAAPVTRAPVDVILLPVAMKPVIDIHAHVFRGIDIPLKGYLLSRTYEWPLKLVAPLVVPVIARCVRRRVRAEVPGFVCHTVLELAYRVMGQGYRRWAEILSQWDLGVVARRLVEAFPGDGIELSVPLMIDYEYWFRNTRDIQIDAQLARIASGIVVPFA